MNAPPARAVRTVDRWAGLLTAVPVALFPAWLIVLSYRLPGHVLAGPARREDSPRAGLRKAA
jgi:hypothetical protein